MKLGARLCQRDAELVGEFLAERSDFSVGPREIKHDHALLLRMLDCIRDLCGRGIHRPVLRPCGWHHCECRKHDERSASDTVTCGLHDKVRASASVSSPVSRESMRAGTYNSVGGHSIPKRLRSPPFSRRASHSHRSISGPRTHSAGAALFASRKGASCCFLWRIAHP